VPAGDWVAEGRSLSYDDILLARRIDTSDTRRCAAVRVRTGGLAEREGFEPSMGCPIPHFQCGALGH
jgi:hypothetical protein